MNKLSDERSDRDLEMETFMKKAESVELGSSYDSQKEDANNSPIKDSCSSPFRDTESENEEEKRDKVEEHNNKRDVIKVVLLGIDKLSLVDVFMIKEI